MSHNQFAHTLEGRMLLKVTHTTDLSYTDLISESVMELRMCPRQEGDQHRLSFNLAIGPRTSVTSYFDWLGNTVHAFTVNKFHRQIRIVATSVIASIPPIYPTSTRPTRKPTITTPGISSISQAPSSILPRFTNWLRRSRPAPANP
jgi:transglutaminase-like putative cysteine protease